MSTNQTAPQTKKLAGRNILAHSNGSAKTYANQTAAEKASQKLRVCNRVWQSPLSRVFYVEVLFN